MAFESNSGFSGEMSFEGYLIFLTVGIYFALNLFSEGSKTIVNIFTIITGLDLISKLIFAIFAHNNINYLFVSAVSSVVYSMVMLIILLIQTASKN